MAGPHDALIAAAAKAALGPSGFRRKGRSRVWIADHGWWLNVVEFQPSGWQRGSYLNVAAHWLWSDSGYLSFDHGGRIDGFIAYEGDAQFAEAAAALADKAAVGARALAAAITSPEALAGILRASDAVARPALKASWPGYHLAVAEALSGQAAEARLLLEAITDDRVKPAASRMAGLVTDPVRVRQGVSDLIDRQREALKLPGLSRSTFA